MLNTSWFKKAVHEDIKHALNYTIHEIEHTRFPENKIKNSVLFFFLIKRKMVLSFTKRFLMVSDFQCTFVLHNAKS